MIKITSFDDVVCKLANEAIYRNLSSSEQISYFVTEALKIKWGEKKKISINGLIDEVIKEIEYVKQGGD